MCKKSQKTQKIDQKGPKVIESRRDYEMDFMSTLSEEELDSYIDLLSVIYN